TGGDRHHPPEHSVRAASLDAPAGVRRRRHPHARARHRRLHARGPLPGAGRVAERGPVMLGVARLKSDVAIASANASLDIVSRRLQAADPKVEAGRSIEALLAHDDLVGDSRQPLLLLRTLAWLQPRPVPIPPDVPLDATVLLFTTFAGVMVALVCGVAPAATGATRRSRSTAGRLPPARSRGRVRTS